MSHLHYQSHYSIVNQHQCLISEFNISDLEYIIPISSLDFPKLCEISFVSTMDIRYRKLIQANELVYNHPGFIYSIMP